MQFIAFSVSPGYPCSAITVRVYFLFQLFLPNEVFTYGKELFQTLVRVPPSGEGEEGAQNRIDSSCQAVRVVGVTLQGGADQNSTKWNVSFMAMQISPDWLILRNIGTGTGSILISAWFGRGLNQIIKNTGIHG